MRGIADPNTLRRLLSVGGYDQPPSPPESPPDIPHDHNNESSSDSESDQDMGDHDQGNPNGDRPWLRHGDVAVSGLQHNLPKHPDKLLPNFDLDDKALAENHIEKFILVVQTMNVQHEDVVCRLFPLTFEGKYSLWYFSLT